MMNRGQMKCSDEYGLYFITSNPMSEDMHKEERQSKENFTLSLMYFCG